jgi:hypothetical protein
MPQDERLKNMLDSIVNDKQEDAEVAFHGYLQDKMKGIVSAVTGEESPEVEVEVEAEVDDAAQTALDSEAAAAQAIIDAAAE